MSVFPDDSYKVLAGTTDPVEVGMDAPFGTDYLGGIYVGGSS